MRKPAFSKEFDPGVVITGTPHHKQPYDTTATFKMNTNRI
jgi:hypothetical protein